MLEFRILGPLEVVDRPHVLPLGGPNRVVSVDRLADDLYAGAPPETAVTQV